MNAFSNVDASGRAAELLDYLDHADRGLRAPKAALRSGLDLDPGSRVLDLGCGGGHELVALEEAGMDAYGVDTSAAMLASARDRLAALGRPARLGQADGAELPFPDGYFDGCRIERVLQHVANPAAVLREVRRTVRPGGRVALLEPDWASFTLASADAHAARSVADQVGADITHRDIGRHLRRLLVQGGFTEVRIEVELVVHTSLEDLSRMVSLERAAERSCASGLLDRSRAAELLREQRRLSDAGAFHSTINRSVLAWACRP
ncbi:methyltransferase domain-containing protein [Streptacidiphilus rugosus]|uniref:methyltransferase domain-containing protein n=1 Tax=Streptacidiphilus rugosus TaxID=405783 RepID=UPI00068B8815|nr:methyltransferase domain-containing protein [Streptacidiphilus rugosus]